MRISVLKVYKVLLQWNKTAGNLVVVPICAICIPKTLLGGVIVILILTLNFVTCHTDTTFSISEIEWLFNSTFHHKRI